MRGWLNFVVSQINLIGLFHGVCPLYKHAMCILVESKKTSHSFINQDVSGRNVMLGAYSALIGVKIKF